jgi:serine protease
VDYLDLLRKILAFGENATFEKHGLPPQELRFVLELTDHQLLNGTKLPLGDVLGASCFVLEPLSSYPSLANFLVLRFPAHQRTLSNRDLFGIGYALRDVLSLTSAEPDLGTPFFLEPEVGPDEGEVEGRGTRFRPLRSDTSAPEDVRWHLEKTHVLSAWNKTKGAGIKIGQPDTGVAAHDTLRPPSLEHEGAIDLLTGKDGAVDPLSPNMRNPGHGTGTASVVVGAERSMLSGVAPEATLVPIRCIDNVAVVNQAPVAAAIAHAEAIGCHVISMSLGGAPSRALYAAVKSAIFSNIIVVAAAGNYVKTVVWPAKYGDVIAVAATNQSESTWAGSCRGPAVDIAAPGEWVWRAERTIPNEATSRIGPGRGTSFATATVAGIAALWLSHHGRDNVVLFARLRGLTVQTLFRSALQATARKSDNWDADTFGAGIVDADKLLSLPLEDIPLGAKSEEVDDDQVAELDAAALGVQTPGHKDVLAPFATEISTIALARAAEEGLEGDISVELASEAVRPSEALSAAITKINESALGTPPADTQKIPERLPKTSVPAIKVPLSVLRAALSFNATSLEGDKGSISETEVQTYLRGPGISEQLARLAKVLATPSRQRIATSGQLLNSVEDTLKKISTGRELSVEGVVALEALVSLTGRPALRCSNGTVDIYAPEASEWQERIYMLNEFGDLNSKLARVGRIDVDGRHVGAGFVVGEGIVMTNRHVLQRFGIPVPTWDNPKAWILDTEVATIDFADSPQHDDATKRFRILEVVAAGSHQIFPAQIDHTNLDCALLRVELRNSSGTDLPQPMELETQNSKGERHRDILVVGYPAFPKNLPRDSNRAIYRDIAEKLYSLFPEYSVKYASPGQVTAAASGQLGTDDYFTMRHDATTLGGSSGSLIISFDNPATAVGLHYGGAWRIENYAHAIPMLAGHSFLGNSKLNWR